MYADFIGRSALRFQVVAILVLSIGCASADTSKSPEKTKTPNAASATTPVIVDVDEIRVLGSAKASIAIVEFADYECPYCRRFREQMFPRLKSQYIDKGVVRYFYKDFPLNIHPQAFGASVASFCAAHQRNYWPMHEKLYTTSVPLTHDAYMTFARELGLKMAKFESCLTGTLARDAINYDLEQGRRFGVTATPTFMIGRIKKNRVFVERTAVGVPTYEVFVKEIEALRR